MAVFDFDFPDDMFDDVLNIFDEAAPKMIDEALPIYESSVKNELQPHRDTGELISSIKSLLISMPSSSFTSLFIAVIGVSPLST